MANFFRIFVFTFEIKQAHNWIYEAEIKTPYIAMPSTCRCVQLIYCS